METGATMTTAILTKQQKSKQKTQNRIVLMALALISEPVDYTDGLGQFQKMTGMDGVTAGLTIDRLVRRGLATRDRRIAALTRMGLLVASGY